jgi:hypothetical protein
MTATKHHLFHEGKNTFRRNLPVHYYNGNVLNVKAARPGKNSIRLMYLKTNRKNSRSLNNLSRGKEYRDG